MDKRQRFRFVGTAALAFALSFAVFYTTRREPMTGDSVPTAMLPVMLAKGDGFEFSPYLGALAQEFPQLASPPYFLRESAGGEVRSAYPAIPALILTPFYAPAVWAKSASGDNSPEEWLAWAREVEPIAAAAVAALGVAIFWLLARSLCHTIFGAVAATALFAFGTDVFSAQAQALWQHTTGVPLYLLGLLFALRGERRDEAWSLIVCGLAFALAIACRRTLAVAICPVLVFLAIRRPRALLLAGLPLATGITMAALMNAAQFGSPLGSDPSSRPWENPDPLATIAGLLVSPARGLFIYFPLALTGLAGLWAAARNRIPNRGFYIALGAGAIAHLILIWGFRWNVWWGGHCFGPRYLADAVPGLLLLNIPLFQSVTRPWPRALLAGPAGAVCMAIHSLGAYHYPCGGWDAIPVDVDQHPARLWDWRDNPLRRCASAALGNRKRKPPTVKDWRVTYRDFPETLTTPAGSKPVRIAVTIVNPTDRIWYGYPKPNGSRLLALHAETLASEGKIAEAIPAALLEDVPPGGSAKLAIGVEIPDEPGRYLVRIGLVQESVASFEAHGAPLAEIPLTVTGEAISNAPGVNFVTQSKLKSMPRNPAR